MLLNSENHVHNQSKRYDFNMLESYDEDENVKEDILLFILSVCFVGNCIIRTGAIEFCLCAYISFGKGRGTVTCKPWCVFN